MAESIIDGTGSGNFWRINSDGAGLVEVTDALIAISGTMEIGETPPTDGSKLNPVFALTYSGTALTQVVLSSATGSYVKDLTYSGTALTDVGSWY